MEEYFVVKTFIDGEQISQHCLTLPLDIHVKLLGLEISKDARYPTDLMVTVERVQ